MTKATVPPKRVEQVELLLDSPELQALMAGLAATRSTGRPGYPLRALVGMVLVKTLYALPTWSRTARLVDEHPGLRRALGAAPSVYACYRFAEKLRHHAELLDGCVGQVLAALHAERPEMGSTVAVDGSDLPAYANGQRYVSKGGPARTRWSDPDASWGHRSAVSTRSRGGYYGFKLHAAVCTLTGLPVAWTVDTARASEVPMVPGLLAQAAGRGFGVRHAVLDKGYDAAAVYEACAAGGVLPIVPLRKTPAVKAGRHHDPECPHGPRLFDSVATAATRWVCPAGECAELDVNADRLHTLIPRSTLRWGDLYRQRGAVEREFGRLKHEWALLPLRTRGLDRVRLHVSFTILGQLAVALLAARAAGRVAA
ncbi:MAG: hypothetical protein QOF60_200 [Actinomycetota bacterium]|nr:hypothetical protein [Actinomycetota bacterium]